MVPQILPTVSEANTVAQHYGVNGTAVFILNRPIHAIDFMVVCGVNLQNTRW